MRRIAGKLFKSQPAIKLIIDGGEYAGRGIISKVRGRKTDFLETKRLPLGEFRRNLCIFIGDCKALSENIASAAGAEIISGGEVFRVLSAEAITAGEIVICERAVLEKTSEEVAHDK